MLPGESEFSEQIATKLAVDLQLGRSLLAASISILTERHSTKPPESDAIVPYRVGHALCIKACKTYRSVLLLSEIGASHDVHILGRTLFETTIATLFVLKERVNFDIKGFSDDDLTSNRRACIYAAFESIQKYLDFQKHTEDPRFASVLAQVPKKIRDRMRDQAIEAEVEIGQFWAARIKRHPRTYSGFKLKGLADKLDPDLSHWYAGMYGEQSKYIHAIDARSHVQADNEYRMMAKWHSSVQTLQTALLPATALVLRCIAELHTHFKFANNPDDDTPTDRELEMASVMLQSLLNDGFNENENSR